MRGCAPSRRKNRKRAEGEWGGVPLRGCAPRDVQLALLMLRYAETEREQKESGVCGVW
jgi:hypothetical protein